MQYAYVKTKATRMDKPSCARRWGPFILLTLATILSMADLVRHLANDAWGTVCSELENHGDAIQICTSGGSSCTQVDAKYDKYCYSQDVMNEFHGGEGFPYLTVYGWVFTIFCTWTGFLCLFIGIFWLINFPQKMRAQWRMLRGGRRRAEAAQGAAALAAPDRGLLNAA